MTSPLLEKIRRRILNSGPVSVAEYMDIALGDPAHGYYATRDPFGVHGDFITAPETSQMFGEIIGIWAAYMWDALGAPTPFALVELGPGRGTLMADMLRAGAVVPGFVAAARVHLVETSPTLRQRQRDALRETSAPVAWHESFADIPADPMILVANEFFDALPIHQLCRAKDGWRERCIGLAPTEGLAWQLAETAAQTKAIPANLRDEAEGTIVEISPRRAALAGEIGARLVSARGAAVIVDYGYWGPAAGDTFQALKGHAHADPLIAPGEADITAHVDFSALCEAARGTGARSFGPMSQGEFLSALGIAPRAEKLKASRSDKAAGIDAAVARLIGPDQMGTLFKVAAFADPGCSPPPPFADD